MANHCNICEKKINLFIENNTLSKDLAEYHLCDDCYNMVLLLTLVNYNGKDKARYISNRELINSKIYTGLLDKKLENYLIEQIARFDSLLIDKENLELREVQNLIERKEVELEQDENLQAEMIAIKNIIVTTGDINKPYRIISPIIYNTTNRGIFSSLYEKLKTKYNDPFYKQLLITPELSPSKSFDGLSLLTLFDTSIGFEGNVGQQSFDPAFYMSIAEMKLRAHKMGGDGIVSYKIDFDLDTTNWGAFYLQAYGTVVKLDENI